MDTFGQRLKAIREAKSLSQERLGFELGVSKATISKWENDKGQPNLGQLARLRRSLDGFISSLDDLIFQPPTLGAGGSTAMRVAEPVDQDGYARSAADNAELAVLLWFRALSAKRRRALLTLIGEG